MTAFAPRYADLPDVSLPYVDTGEGAPIVFMHGALGDWRTWRGVLQHIPRSFRAIAYTQRWFGTDPRSHRGASFGTQQQADDLISFLDALALPATHVVAWSLSAHSALAAAVRAPDRILSLRLYDLGFPTFVDAPETLSAIAAYGEATFAPIVDATGRGDRIGAVRAMIDASGETGHFDQQPQGVREVHLDNGHSIDLVLKQTPPVLISSSDLRNLNAPTSVAWGERSGGHLLVSQAAAALIPRCRGQEIEGANHLWPETAPAAFARFVTSEINTASRDRGAQG